MEPEEQKALEQVADNSSYTSYETDDESPDAHANAEQPHIAEPANTEEDQITETREVQSSAEDTQTLALMHPELAELFVSLEKIGSGSQAAVLKAVDASGEAVAIKVFDIASADSFKDIELFEREIETLKNLDIHGVPHCIKSFRNDHYLYLIEEYIDARSLEYYIHEKRLFSFDEIVKILTNAAKIIQSLGGGITPIIHRDIKPANLLITDDLDVYMIDFGVVTARHQLTISSTFAGTAGYMAPEQLNGKVTQAADIYSLGVTMLQLISSVAPTDMEMDGLEIRLEKLLPDTIPDWFANILRKMTLSNPKTRFQNGNALLKSLENKGAGLPQVRSFDDSERIKNAERLEKKRQATERLKSTPVLAAILSYILGGLWCYSIIFCDYAYWDDVRFYSYKFGMLIFTPAFLAWVEFAMRRVPRPNKKMLFWPICMMLLSLSILWNDSGYSYLALHTLAIYWVMIRSGRLTEGRTGAFLPLDMLSGLINMISGLFLRIRRLFYGVQSLAQCQKNWKNIFITLLIIVLAIPLMHLTVSLLASADANFASTWNSLTGLFSFEMGMPHWLEKILVSLLYGWPAGLAIYSIVTRSQISEKSMFTPDSVRKVTDKLQVVPKGAIYGVFGTFIAIYLLFFGVQAGHLFGAFHGVVPGTLTASDYAREGFFQLCKVMLINFGLFAFAMKGSCIPVYKSRPLKILCTVFLGESAFLAITAASKLGMYIDRFGTTSLRVLSFWGILVLFAGCILGMVNLFRHCRVIDKWIWFAVSTFVLFAFFF